MKVKSCDNTNLRPTAGSVGFRLLLILWLAGVSGRAATYDIDAHNGQTVSPAASGDIFTDSNPGGNYSANENYTVTFQAPVGQTVQLAFTAFALGSGDTLTLYDGATTGSPILGAAVTGSYTGTGLPKIASTGRHLTARFTSNGSGTASGWSAAITLPAACNDFTIAVANYSANTITRYNSEGAFTGTIVSGGQVSNPNFMLGRANGNYLLANGATDDVEEYNLLTGAHVGSFIESPGGGLDFPEQMRIGSDGNLYIASQNNDLVRRFNASTGALIGTFLDSGDGINNPLGLIFDASGNAYVSNNEDGGQIRKFDSSGNFDSILFDYAAGYYPRGLELGPDGNIYAIVWVDVSVTTASDGSADFTRIDKFTMPAGTQSTFATLDTGSNAYNGIDWGPDGNLYIADYGENEVQVFNSSGTQIRVFTWRMSGPHHVVFLPCTESDFGDLPESYPVTLSDDGPRHVITGLKLGSNIDDDADGFPSTNADGDDTSDSPDDEDGVTIPALTAGQVATVVVNASATGKVNAFFDWNGDDDFDDAGETLTELSVVAGNNNLMVSVPLSTVTGQNLGARFRLSTDGGLEATGAAEDGEVEDYLVTVAEAVTYDFGDLPDTTAGTGTGDYQTTLANNGPRHVINPNIRLGTTVDDETNGQPNSGASLDDTTDSPDDEDGVTVAHLTDLVPGAAASVTVSVYNNTGSTGTLWGWIDWNADGDVDAGETASTAVPGNNSVSSTELNFGTVPFGAASTFHARFRFSTDSGDASSPTGEAPDGELEDYVASLSANIVHLGNRVWLDNGAGGGVANDGLINGAEAGINGVTVELYAADGSGNPTGAALLSQTTAGGGHYRFQNLPPGSYVVVIPETNFDTGGDPLFGLYGSGTSIGTSNGPDPDVNTDDSDDNGYNAISPATTGVKSPAVTLTVGGEPTGETDLGSGDSSFTDANANYTVDFGFVNVPPTAVTLARLKGWWERGSVTVEWETVTELNSLGFDLFRIEAGGRVRVNADLVPALNVERGGVYRVSEALPRPTGKVLYLLVEQETTGRQIEYGPFEIAVDPPAAQVGGIRVVSDGLEIRFQGEPGAEYVIESTDDMAAGRWIELGRFRADPGGLIEFHQPEPGAESLRFFRALRP